MSLLERISELRKANENISVNKLEKEAGLSRGSMAKWDAHAPSPDKLKKVAEYFGVSVDYLLTGRDKKETPPPEGGGIDLSEYSNLPEEKLKILRQINEKLSKMSVEKMKALSAILEVSEE